MKSFGLLPLIRSKPDESEEPPHNRLQTFTMHRTWASTLDTDGP
jgi:hypothetical protein